MDEARPGVLLIDDEEDIVSTFTLFLERYGYSVDSAGIGAEALAKLGENLYDVVELAGQLDLPLNVGTEMNRFGQKLIDDFEAPELEPVREAFIEGAYFIYGHTMMERALGMGYQSGWAKANLSSRVERNRFYGRIGHLVPPGAESLARLGALDASLQPQELLESLRT